MCALLAACCRASACPHLGLLVGQEQVDAYNAFDNAGDKAALVMKGFSNTMGNVLMPVVTKLADGSYRASGGKYYIGNANQAAMVSTFGKMADSGEYIFFVAVTCPVSSYQ